MAKEGRTHLRFRIDPQLEKQLEEAAKKSGRTLTAEITERLKQSFDIPALVRRLAPDASDIASDVSDDMGAEFSSVHKSFRALESQIRAILSHLGLPDPVEVAKAREAEEYAKRKAERERAEAAKRIQTGGVPNVIHTTKDDGEKK
jgi:hypothetical protein